MTGHEQYIHEIEIYGFTIVEAVLSSEEAQEMRHALIVCAEQHAAESLHRGTASHVANLPTLDPIFFKCLDHSKILPLLEHFLGHSLILGSLNSRILRPGDGVQGLHSDIPCHMLNMASPVMMNTVWMLDDFTASNGATRVVPGSHKSGLAEPPEGFEVKHIVQAIAPAGSVIIFNGQCWHGGSADTSDHNRHALFGHYRKSMLMFQVDPHDKFPKEWFEQLNPRQRELLRMTKGLREPHAADAHLR